ncbi:hypothetical protein [Streptomyces sp. NPDC059262]|uniref:hypothetical protein n=1 Tax=Streptomyces sp. NPDC059262 TaxID=3346797 RepID=UPI0036BF834B
MSTPRPTDPKSVRSNDCRAPSRRTECDNVGIIKVHGWWCTTTVSSVMQDGEVVIGGATPRATIHSAGFRTRCSGNHARIRQHHEVQRDSWSGRRAYNARGHTPWTTAQHQDHGTVAAPCPRGRVDTCNYRLAIAVEIAGIKADDSPTASADIRADCATGIS